MPVLHVDRVKDVLKGFKPQNQLEAKQFSLYNAEKMHGLPVGVQIVGRRLEEEKVLEGMKIIEQALAKQGKQYILLEVD